MYQTEHFDIRELVPKEIYANTANKEKLWLLFNKTALTILDRLRKDYGAIIVNDWMWGGDIHYAGFRPWNCETGASLSQHKFGRAFDPKPQDVSSEQIRQDIIDQKCDYMRQISAVEMDIDWVHFDLRNSTDKQVLQFWP